MHKIARLLQSLSSHSSQQVNMRWSPDNSLSLFVSSPTEKLLSGQRDVLNSDLQRVLGHPLTQETSQLPPISPQAMYVYTWPCTMAPAVCLHHSVSCRPPSDAIPLRHISINMSEGLATNTTFPNSTYLYSTKAEIRKIMKQRYYC